MQNAPPLQKRKNAPALATTTITIKVRQFPAEFRLPPSSLGRYLRGYLGVLYSVRSAIFFLFRHRIIRSTARFPLRLQPASPHCGDLSGAAKLNSAPPRLERRSADYEAHTLPTINQSINHNPYRVRPHEISSLSCHRINQRCSVTVLTFCI